MKGPLFLAFAILSATAHAGFFDPNGTLQIDVTMYRLGFIDPTAGTVTESLTATLSNNNNDLDISGPITMINSTPGEIIDYWVRMTYTTTVPAKFYNGTVTGNSWGNITIVDTGQLGTPAAELTMHGTSGPTMFDSFDGVIDFLPNGAVTYGPGTTPFSFNGSGSPFNNSLVTTSHQYGFGYYVRFGSSDPGESLTIHFPITMEATPVPEPSSLLGLLGLVIATKRRKRLI